MPRNSFFQFKQFRIVQSDCAMKVTTEGCIFGASVVLEGTEKKILDIGSGTGLLALMLAQRSDAQVIGIELDETASKQAAKNFDDSPWQERLVLVEGSVQTFASSTEEKFDLIVSNPPFFSNHLKNEGLKNSAIHDHLLPQEDLVDCVERLLDASGSFWVIYPEWQFSKVQGKLQQVGFSLSFKIIVRNKPGPRAFRVIGAFKRGVYATETSEIDIRDAKGKYSESFLALIKDYYL